MANNKDLFGRQPTAPVRPITADMCTIAWYGENALGNNSANRIVSGATNITIAYQQQVIRRRTLSSAGGRPLAVIYPTQPIGSIQIQRLFADMNVQLGGGTTSDVGVSGTHDLFSYPGWNVCNGTAGLDITFDGASAYPDCATKNPGFSISGAVVTGYNISAEAEGLTIVDNVSIEFLQLFQKAA